MDVFGDLQVFFHERQGGVAARVGRSGRIFFDPLVPFSAFCVRLKLPCVDASPLNASRTLALRVLRTGRGGGGGRGQQGDKQGSCDCRPEGSSERTLA